MSNRTLNAVTVGYPAVDRKMIAPEKAMARSFTLRLLIFQKLHGITPHCWILPFGLKP